MCTQRYKNLDLGEPTSHRIASHRTAPHRIASHRIASRRIASNRVTSHHLTQPSRRGTWHRCRCRKVKLAGMPQRAQQVLPLACECAHHVSPVISRVGALACVPATAVRVCARFGLRASLLHSGLGTREVDVPLHAVPRTDLRQSASPSVSPAAERSSPVHRCLRFRFRAWRSAGAHRVSTSL